jgi:uncharacterized DUF497 family protein
MGYEYDEEKSNATLRERGFDFEFAARVFEVTSSSTRTNAKTLASNAT